MDADQGFELGADYAAELDAADPLAALADRFYDPDDEWYMDGNSLGLVSTAAEEAVDRAVAEWKELAIRGWTDADPPWFYYGERLGDRLAPLVGAKESEVVVANSTTVNIHTLVGTFYDRVRDDEPERTNIVVDDLDFPTDHYAVRAQLRQRGADPDEALTVVESRDGRTIDEDDVIDALDDETAVVFLPSVLYRSGQLLDVERITEAAHDRGILAGFDLAHSVGVVAAGENHSGIEAVRAKSLRLTDYLTFLVDERLPECAVGTPRDPERRGGHVAIEHPEAYRVSEALKDRGVVVDFRPPNVVRLCPSPLYTSFEDVWEVVEQLRRVLEDEEYATVETRGGGVT